MELFRGKLKERMAGMRNKQIIQQTSSWLKNNKLKLIKGIGLSVGAIGLITAISWGGNQYVKQNTNQVYHLYLAEQEAGVVSDPEVVEKFLLSKIKGYEEQYPGVHLVFNTDQITYESEKAFKIESDDETALSAIDQFVTAKAIGVELRIEGNLMGVVKDRETAEGILETFQSKYLPEQEEKGSVGILSFAEEEKEPLSTGQSQIEEIEFLEEIEFELVDTSPSMIIDPQEILDALEIGDVTPGKYIVQSGDCINCIAYDFGISPQIIFDNNELDESSVLQIGQELDLTVTQPTLSVRTVERTVNLVDVHYPTEYELDDTLRVGQTRTVREGVPGKKLVTHLITKINGFYEEEELVDEEIVEEPIPAIIRRGTMVVRGEGTGSFAMPVKNAKTSSSYGMRWGRLHAGIDFTSKSRDIYASDNGTVTTAGWHNSFGNYVIIDHKNGFKTLYAHLSRISTSKGSIVEKGDKIGVMGSTGNSTGVHLHFEIHKSGKAVNPSSYLG